MQKDLIQFLLNEVRVRPGMYLTAYRISYLDIYLTGVLTTCATIEKDGKYSGSFFGEGGFLQWSWKKYHLGWPSFRLSHYLLFAEEDERTALDLFFEDLKTFDLQNRK